MSDGLTDTMRASKMPMELYSAKGSWTQHDCERCSTLFLIYIKIGHKNPTPHWCPMCGTRYDNEGVEVKDEK